MTCNRVRQYGTFLLLTAASLCSAVAGSISVDARDSDGKPLANTVITLLGPETVPVMNNPLPVVRQRDLQFDPHVLVIRQDTNVVFPNLDDTRHQVFSFSAVKRFSTRLFGGEESPPIHFDKLGLVPVGCNIHDQMHAYIYITNAPQFAVTDQSGRALFNDLPAGDYQLAAFHPWQPDPTAQQYHRLTLAEDVMPKGAGHWTVTVATLRPDPREQERASNPLLPKKPFLRR